jgi:hypothetical protein
MSSSNKNAVLVAVRAAVIVPAPVYVKDALKTAAPAENVVTNCNIPAALFVTLTVVADVAIVVTAVVFLIVNVASPLPDEQNKTGSKYVIL